MMGGLLLISIKVVKCKYHSGVVATRVYLVEAGWSRGVEESRLEVRKRSRVGAVEHQ